MLLVESDGLKREKDINIQALLKSKGYYYLKQYEQSDWYVNQQWETIYNRTFTFH